MNKEALRLLEKVYSKEIDGAFTCEIGLYQTKSKLAEKLEESGYLAKETIFINGRHPVKIEGYRLTLLGNMTYCMSC